MASAKPTAWVVAAMLASNACAAEHRPPTGKLTEAACRPAVSVETRDLPPAWARVLPYTNACEVKDDKGATVLVVLAVSAARYYEKLPSGTETVAMPKPLLRTPGGETVGALPLNFPDDPPFALQLTFGNWVEGWPRRIDMFVKDPTVTGDHAIEPLLWDAASRHFVQKAKE